MPVDKTTLTLLPTGKPHVSWSEIRTWMECSYRHKLRHVDGLDFDKPSSILDFGTATHAGCEAYVKTREMRHEVAIELLMKAFDARKGEPSYEPATLELMIKQVQSILADVPPFLEAEFPGWELVAAEHPLYEPLSDVKPHHAFKGYIDLIIRVPSKTKRSKNPLTWIIDYKTSNSFWSSDKKSDPKMTGQLVGYKHYWLQEMNSVDIANTRCGFILLKRNAKPGSHCELVPVSVGNVTLNRTLKVINNCVSSIQRGMAIKNRDSCKYCSYRETEHCK